MNDTDENTGYLDIEYAELSQADIMPEMFRSFERRQQVTHVLRKSDPSRGVELARGEGWTVVETRFTEDWDDAKYLSLCDELRRTLASGGAVIAAYAPEAEAAEEPEEPEEYDWYVEDDIVPPCRAVIGFCCAVEAKRFGSGEQYVELSVIQVSAPYRRRGIGKGLFRRAAKAARAFGAKKLYISAHSSVESQAFYKAVGCVEATEYNESIAAREPYDCQLEYDLFPRRTDDPALLTIEEYETMAGEILDELPQEFFDRLNGGVVVRPERKLHPQSVPGAPMYIMGEYTRDPMMGRMVYLYYGSFAATYGRTQRDVQRDKLRGIITHELRHHMEWRSGTRELEVEDEKGLRAYLEKYMRRKNKKI